MRKIAILSGNGTISCQDAPIPSLEKGMVQIKVEKTLVSPGTELKGWDALAAQRNSPNPKTAPKPFGYSATGVVQDVGEGVSRFTEGDRVAAIGAGYALHADIIVVPQNLCVFLPDSVSFEDGSYAMLLATALQVVRRAKPEIGERYLISGLGIVGLLTGKILELSGCKVAGVDMHPLRIEKAKGFGFEDAFLADDPDVDEKLKAFTHDEGFDGAVVAFGGTADDAMELIVNNMRIYPDGHHTGSILTVGWPIFSYTNGIGGMNNIDLMRSSRTGPGYHDDQWERASEDYPSVLVRWTTRKNLDLCLELVKKKKIDVNYLTTHVVEFEKIQETIDELLDTSEKMLGVVFSY
jgi:threonine dehydrogenase-like Zn-dependent dehydrogenase